MIYVYYYENEKCVLEGQKIIGPARLSLLIYTILPSSNLDTRGERYQ